MSKHFCGLEPKTPISEFLLNKIWIFTLSNIRIYWTLLLLCSDIIYQGRRKVFKLTGAKPGHSSWKLLYVNWCKFSIMGVLSIITFLSFLEGFFHYVTQTSFARFSKFPFMLKGCKVCQNRRVQLHPLHPFLRRPWVREFIKLMQVSFFHILRWNFCKFFSYLERIECLQKVREHWLHLSQ